MSDIITGRVFVVADNIDTDQIIPAEYLNLVPTIPEEYEKLGSYALSGLPEGQGPFVEEGRTKAEYAIIVAGKNFGCGSSREHAPISLGAAGVKAVVAESFARIFFRNCIATGELFPLEATIRLCDSFTTGEMVEIDLNSAMLTRLATKESFSLQSLGEARQVIDEGGLFEFARRTGMIS